MFDLNELENYHNEHGHKLTEEEIIEIFKSENATIPQYEERMNEWHKKTDVKIPSLTAEERLLRVIFGDDYPEDIEAKRKRERMKRLSDIKLAKYPMPEKQHLSIENQKIIVEGSLWMVFEITRYWYQFFEGNINEEEIYYIALDALIKSAKYLCHLGKPCFEAYLEKAVRQRMNNLVARYNHINYLRAQKLIYKDFEFLEEDELKDTYLDVFKNKEIQEKPSKIYNYLKNETEEIDYIKDVSSSEFMSDYKKALEELSEIKKMIMTLTYDNNGEHIMTNREIGDYLSIEPKKVSYLRKQAIKELRKQKNLNKYL